MKQGQSFEKLTEKIFLQLIKNPEYERVEHNVMLEGKDGPRQIDVLITSQAAGIEIKTIIECKDYKGKVSVGVIDAIHSVIQDVNANKGIVVSSNGFSSKAINKAKRLGISLFTAHEALSEKWSLEIEIPVLITEVDSVNVIPKFKITIEGITSFPNSAIHTINDINLLESFTEHLKSLNATQLQALKKSDNRYRIKEVSPPFFIRDTTGNKYFIDDFEIIFDTTKKYYFGYLGKKDDVKILKDIIDKRMNVIFKPNFLIDYERKFQHIDEKDIPSYGEIRIECLKQPDINEFRVNSVNVTKIK